MKKFLLSATIFLLIIIGTIAVIAYGKGYRFGLNEGVPRIAGTGLFVATSRPDGAQVFINGTLTTATDNTISLIPGTYQVKIEKQGYVPWQKTIKIQKETVTKEDAFLIPSAPKLENITAVGVLNPVLDPTKTRVAYVIASASASENGIYVLDLSSRPILTLGGNSKQLADDTLIDFSSSSLSWSPDSNQILATVSAGLGASYLLSAGETNTNPRNVTGALQSIDTLWKTQKTQKENARLNGLNKELRKVVAENFKIIEWSPDESKILYTASGSATLPIILKPPLIGANTTPEQRDIAGDELYIYDTKEDRNYKVNAKLPENNTSSLSWFSDSRHLIYVHDGKVDIVEYDGLNQTTIYAGPFIGNYAFPWPDGSKIAILTNLNNPNNPPNLYTISLR